MFLTSSLQLCISFFPFFHGTYHYCFRCTLLIPVLVFYDGQCARLLFTWISPSQDSSFIICSCAFLLSVISCGRTIQWTCGQQLPLIPSCLIASAISQGCMCALFELQCLIAVVWLSADIMSSHTGNATLIFIFGHVICSMLLSAA